MPLNQKIAISLSESHKLQDKDRHTAPNQMSLENKVLIGSYGMAALFVLGCFVKVQWDKSHMPVLSVSNPASPQPAPSSTPSPRSPSLKEIEEGYLGETTRALHKATIVVSDVDDALTDAEASEDMYLINDPTWRKPFYEMLFDESNTGAKLRMSLYFKSAIASDDEVPAPIRQLHRVRDKLGKKMMDFMVSIGDVLPVRDDGTYERVNPETVREAARERREIMPMIQDTYVELSRVARENPDLNYEGK